MEANTTTNEAAIKPLNPPHIDLDQKVIPTYQTMPKITVSYNNPYKATQRHQIQCSSYVYKALQDYPDLEYKESFHIILLNRANQILGISCVGTGGLAGVVADPKIVYQHALMANASSIILLHNHPSGNKATSQADDQLTDKLVQAGKFLDLPVLDHIILTNDGYYSYADEGRL